MKPKVKNPPGSKNWEVNLHVFNYIVRLRTIKAFNLYLLFSFMMYILVIHIANMVLMKLTVQNTFQGIDFLFNLHSYNLVIRYTFWQIGRLSSKDDGAINLIRRGEGNVRSSQGQLNRRPDRLIISIAWILSSNICNQTCSKCKFWINIFPRTD